MGKTKRHNPYARELEKPQYRGRYIKDKRKVLLEKLNNEASTEDLEDWRASLRDTGTPGSEGPEGGRPVGPARPDREQDTPKGGDVSREGSGGSST